MLITRVGRIDNCVTCKQTDKVGAVTLHFEDRHDGPFRIDYVCFDCLPYYCRNIDLQTSARMIVEDHVTTKGLLGAMDSALNGSNDIESSSREDSDTPSTSAFEMEFRDRRVVAKLPSSRPLEQLSHCLQQSIAWMLGSGAYHFSVDRAFHAVDGDFLIKVQSAFPLKTLVFSGIAKLQTLLDQGYIPKNIPLDDNWRYDIEQSYGPGGLLDLSNLQLHQMTIADYAYTTSDLLIFFFLRGATSIRFRLSQGSYQIWIKGSQGIDTSELFSESATFGFGQQISTIPR